MHVGRTDRSTEDVGVGTIHGIAASVPSYVSAWPGAVRSCIAVGPGHISDRIFAWYADVVRVYRERMASLLTLRIGSGLGYVAKCWPSHKRCNLSFANRLERIGFER